MSTATEERSDWMSLPNELLASILSRLVPQDYIRFSLVCKTWNSVAREEKQHLMTSFNNVPFLLVPNYKSHSSSWSLYSFTRRRFLDFKLEIPYDVTHFRGSSRGWLAFSYEDTYGMAGIALFNPFTQTRISLPPIVFQDAEDHFCSVEKVVLSADPSLHPDDYIVAALISIDCQGILAMYQPSQDENWTTHSIEENDHDNDSNQDYQDQDQVDPEYPDLTDDETAFDPDHSSSVQEYLDLTDDDLVLHKNGEWVYENRRCRRTTREVVPPCYWVRGAHLVEARNGDVLMIEFFGCHNEARVAKQQADSSFVPVEDLNGDAVFMGNGNYSIAVAPDSYYGIEADCLYYWDFADRGIMKFNFKDKTTSCFPFPNDTGRPIRGGLWIYPTVKL
ncbi:F-box/kelch-repeat protein At1g57790 [Linum grandiflorum]